MRKYRIPTAAMALVAVAGVAVGQKPRYTSPPAHASVTIAGHRIQVDYYAPSAHGRKIMGALVPYGEIWCTGANIATGFTTDANLRIGNLNLPSGKYSIWTLPTEKEWTLIFNRESGQFHLDYKPSQDFGRTKMEIQLLSAPMETFSVELRSTGGRNGELALMWENTEVWCPFTVQP